jgi:hypothetical protein
LLGKDGLLVKLVIDRIGKQVAARHKVSQALNCAIAHNGDLRGASWRCRQRDAASTVGVDRHRVVGRQRQQRVVFVDRNVRGRQDLECERIRARAACCVYHPTGDVIDWHAHDSILPDGNCTN